MVIYEPQQTRSHPFNRGCGVQGLQIPDGDRQMLSMFELRLVRFARLEPVHYGFDFGF
jgi:hypothetical protein